MSEAANLPKKEINKQPASYYQPQFLTVEL